MNNNRYLTKNIFLFTISNFAPKILVFLMVPLYTNILTTEEYGIVDLMQTLMQLLLPILTLNISEAVMRFSIDPHSNEKIVFNYGIKYCLMGIIIVLLGCTVGIVLNIMPFSYLVCFCLLFASNTIYTMFSNFLRGIDKITLMVYGSILNTAVMVGCNLLFLLVFQWGIEGYLFAQTAGFFLASLIWFLAGRLWNYISFSEKDKNTSDKMLRFSRPLIVNSVAWWINNASSRYIIAFLCGASLNGLYAAAYKIPTILTMVQNIFMQAWQLSAIKSFEQKEKYEFYKKIYKIYNALLVIATAGIILFVKVLAKILFAKDFFVAWRIVPFLLLASLFGALSGFIGAIFTASNETKIVGKTTAYGAIFNIVLGILMIWKWDIMGAAVATMISYLLVWMIRCYEEKKREKLNLIEPVAIISYILLLLQALIIQIDRGWVYIIVTLIFFVLFAMYFKTLRNDFIVKAIAFVKQKIR